MQNQSYHVRRGALKALGEFADAGALPSLAVFIEENERSLGEEAERARDRVRLRQRGR